MRKDLSLESENSFYVICDSRDKNYVNEIRICYDLGEPGKEKQINCYEKDLELERNSCDFPLRLAKKNDDSHYDSNKCSEDEL